MRFMKSAATAIVLILCFVSVPTAGAIEITPPPAGTTKTDSPVIITGYAHQGLTLHYVQIFNSSDEVVNVANWKLRYTASGLSSAIEITLPAGLIKPSGYIVAANSASIPSADVVYELSIPGGVAGAINSIQLVPPATYLDHSVAVKTDAQHIHWRRNISTSTGNYLSTFTAFTPDVHFTLYGNGFYDYPESTSLQVTEILANPRACSPLETAGDCVDYVKFYNPSTQTIDLAQFRLRVGYLGQNPSASNTFSLAGAVAPGHYVIVAKNAANQPVSLTNSGAFLWLEDSYGLKLYDATVVEYPDASADTKKGQAWAYDSTDGMWKWTIQPTPFASPSVFPAPITKPKAVTASMLTACKEGQYRSEETNRCRSIAGDATALAPCDDDEERNPATNRCRKLASLAGQQLTPCKEGQERNPATNRCRNIAANSPPNAAFAVEPVSDTGKAFIGWWALGGVGILALGYGAWEWRQEVANSVQKIGSFFTSAK